MKNILIIGAGKLGLPLAYKLNAQGHNITTLSISAKSFDEKNQKITHISADIFHLDGTLNHLKFDWIYVILTARQRSLLGYQQAYVNSVSAIVREIDLTHVQRLVYVSSTQVYGQNQGETVDDSTPPNPSSDFGKILYAGELLWQAHLGDRLTIIRPSGILGDSHDFLNEMAKNLTQINENHWLNLIHRHDVIRILASLPDYEKQLNMRNQTCKASYILTQTAIIRHQLLNSIRQSQQQTAIIAPANLPTTGKKIQANHLQDLLDSQNITLTKITDMPTLSN